MQVQSKKYIDDYQSIDLAVEKYFQNTDVINSDDELTNLFSKYKNDRKFLHFVTTCYYYLQPRG